MIICWDLRLLDFSCLINLYSSTSQLGFKFICFITRLRKGEPFKIFKLLDFFLLQIVLFNLISLKSFYKINDFFPVFSNRPNDLQNCTSLVILNIKCWSRKM